jgi:hypothetical protein
MPDAPELRDFANLERETDGTYNDDALVDIWRASVEDVAGSFGANKVPNCLKAIEVLGIMQARYWNVATLNEFRDFVGLTKHKTFEDINPDPVVAKKLKQLYDSPDAVELYPGIVAEKPKPPMTPGSGLCVNFTTSRAILSDAVALIRGDRFYTVDYNPKNLTNWGYNESNSDLTVNQGHVMHKLIFRAFPNHFAPNSIYAHFPMVIPAENKAILDTLETADKYSWHKPGLIRGPPLTIRSAPAVRRILANQADFKVTWGEAIEHSTGSPASRRFCLAGDGAANAANRALVQSALYSPPRWADEMAAFCSGKAAQLLAKYGVPLVSAEGRVVREVDVVRDVFGLATTHVNAELYALPLKTADRPHGLYGEQELCGVLLAQYASIFSDADAAGSFRLRELARTLTRQLGGLVAARAKAGALADAFDKVGEALADGSNGAPKLGLASYRGHLTRRLLEGEKSVEDAVFGSILPMAAAGTANQTMLLAQCLDYYLGKGIEHMPEIHRLANLQTKEADDVLMR